MTDRSPLWPARLHHFRLDSDRPERLVRFYERGLGMRPRPLGEGCWLLSGGQRRLLIGRGERGALPFVAFGVETAARLDDLREFVRARGFDPAPSPSPLFAESAFALRDPDGRTVVFGLPEAVDPGADPLPGRLQHVVVASSRMDEAIAFYRDGLGFVVSDRVHEDGAATACFLRSDPEHHSFAVFRAPESRPDHHAYETGCWNDIRDWADHFAALGVPLWWGPGRHGPGNNLFFMVEDPDGNKVELSAELESMPRDRAARDWPHEERTLNLWGGAWMRS